MSRRRLSSDRSQPGGRSTSGGLAELPTPPSRDRCLLPANGVAIVRKVVVRSDAQRGLWASLGVRGSDEHSSVSR
jgi:hypothetical protein